MQFEFDHFVRRPALLSDNVGWASYPVMVKGTLIKGQIALELSVEVQYSSTCPCSAALARQLIQSSSRKTLAMLVTSVLKPLKIGLVQKKVLATPQSAQHGENLGSPDSALEDLPITQLIMVEESLKTPVQSAVKREDEQELHV